LFGTLGSYRHAELSEEMPDAMQALATAHWPRRSGGSAEGPAVPAFSLLP
jgi:hypothetical protein